MTLEGVLIVGALLFVIGLYGVITRRNLVAILISVEIMLAASMVNFVAFSAFTDADKIAGHIFTLFIIGVAAAEVGVGLAIFLAVFRNAGKVDVDAVKGMRF